MREYRRVFTWLDETNVNCEWPVSDYWSRRHKVICTSLFLIAWRGKDTAECLLRVKWSDQGSVMGYRTLRCVNRKGGCLQVMIYSGSTPGVWDRDVKGFEKIFLPLPSQRAWYYKCHCLSCVHCSVYHCSKDVGALSPADASAVVE